MKGLIDLNKWAGFESPGEWDDHHAVFGVDGADIQYAVSSELVL